MAVKAGYELPYTGEEVQEMLEQIGFNTESIEQLEESVGDIQALTNMEIEELLK